mgnify:CR=1 FL=1
MPCQSAFSALLYQLLFVHLSLVIKKRIFIVLVVVVVLTICVVHLDVVRKGRNRYSTNERDKGIMRHAARYERPNSFIKAIKDTSTSLLTSC